MQAAKSEIGLNTIGAVIDDAPAPILLVAPTIEEQKKYVKLKLQPMIDATPSLAKKVLEQKSRDEDGSTTRFKKFRGGYLQLTGANASSGLQMISVRILIREEISEWPLDVDGRGDPMDLSLERTNFWKGREKVINLSTPGLKGTCRISARYEASDQSRYHVPCPHCEVFQTLEWDHLQFKAKTVDDLATDSVAYICAANGCVIEHRQKAGDARQGALGRAVSGPIGDAPGLCSQRALLAGDDLDRRCAVLDRGQGRSAEGEGVHPAEAG